MAKEDRIGSMTKSRGGWGDINPVTKVIKDKKKENDRKQAKRELQRDKYKYSSKEWRM